jgi:hypothetical protein
VSKGWEGFGRRIHQMGWKGKTRLRLGTLDMYYI